MADNIKDDLIDYEAFRQQIVNGPLNTSIASKIGDRIAVAKGRSASIDFLKSVQTCSPTALPGLLLVLFRALGRREVSSLFLTQLSKLQSSPEAKVIFEAINTSDWINESILVLKDKLEAISPTVIKATISLLAPEPDVIMIGDLLSSKWRFGNNNLNWLAPPLSKFLGTDRLDKLDHYNYLRHQDSILDEGWLTYEDYDRNIRYCADSFIYYDRVFYTFTHPMPWCFVSGTEPGIASGIFIPALNLIVRLSFKGERATTPASYAGYCTNLMLRITSAKEVRKSSTPPIGANGERTVTALVGGVENLAHQVWNSYSGLDRAIKNKITSRIARILFFGTEFFGDPSAIFQDLQAIPMHHERQRGIGRSEPFSGKEILCNIGSMLMAQDFVWRIVDNAVRQTISSDRLKELRNELKDSKYIIYIGIRMGDKSWNNQVEGIADLITRVDAEFSKTVWVLDGFSVPSGKSYIPDFWLTFSEECKNVVSAIRKISPGARVTSISGLPLNEMISIAQAIDLYVAPVGTAQHKIGWFSNADGIVYASTEWQKRGWIPGLRAIEGKMQPSIIYGKPVTSEYFDRRLTDGRLNLHMIDLDKTELYELVRNKLASFSSGGRA